MTESKAENSRSGIMLAIMTAILGLVAGVCGTWISGISANGTQLTQLSVSVANMQVQMKEIQDGIKEARVYADSNYVRQDRFDQFIKAYDTNHSDAVAYRANTDAKLDQIMSLLNTQGSPRRKESR